MADGNQSSAGGGHPVVYRIGDHELEIRRRYEILSIVNDFLIGVWFAIGSVLFFWSNTDRVGIWLFLIGSLQLLIRPTIRFIRNVHLKRITRTPSVVLGSSPDF